MPKLIRFHKTGGPEVLQYDDMPARALQSGEIRLKEVSRTSAPIKSLHANPQTTFLGAARVRRYARGGLSSPPRLSSSGWSRGGSTVIFPATIRAATAGFPDALDPAFKLDGVKLTPYNLITSYNNFCEWGLSKEDPQQLAKSWLEDRAVDS
jgi:hypothetical protein